MGELLHAAGTLGIQAHWGSCPQSGAPVFVFVEAQGAPAKLS